MLNSKIIKRLPEILGKVSEKYDANAAVSLILKPKLEDYEILFVKRVERISDPWSGQIAFPGGKRDPEDRNLKDTVIREVFEETSIKLMEINFLGVSKIISSKPKRNLRILPFIVFLEESPVIDLNKKELDKFFWVSYKKIESNRGIVNFGSRNVPAYILGDDIVWGVTYKILRDFNKIVELLINKKKVESQL